MCPLKSFELFDYKTKYVKMLYSHYIKHLLCARYTVLSSGDAKIRYSLWLKELSLLK